MKKNQKFLEIMKIIKGLDLDLSRKNKRRIKRLLKITKIIKEKFFPDELDLENFIEQYLRFIFVPLESFAESRLHPECNFTDDPDKILAEKININVGNGLAAFIKENINLSIKGIKEVI